MSKIIAFTGSNSETSINDQLLKYTLQTSKTLKAEYIDLKVLNVPMYSSGTENKSGIPVDIQKLRDHIDAAEALIVAVNEHNGTMSAFFKNITDWLSRTGSYLQDKKIFLLSTSPGGGGAKHSLSYTVTNFEKFGGTIVSQFSLPSFADHFIEGELKGDYTQELKTKVESFENKLK